MLRLILQPNTLVWALLVLATVYSVLLGRDEAVAAAASGNAVYVQLVVIAMIKVRLVLIHFMGAGRGPRITRYMCDAWVVLVAAILAAMPWISTVQG